MREPGGARPRRGLEVEDRDAHAALGEPGGERRPELAHAAGDDRDAALDVEERVRHGAIVLAVVAGHDAGAPRSTLGGSYGRWAPPRVGPRVSRARRSARRDDARDRLAAPLRLAAYVVAWATLVLAAAMLSPGGGLSRRSLSLALAVVALGAVGVCLARGRRPLPARGPWRATLRDPVLATLAVTVTAAAVYLAAVAFLTTPNDWDGLTYHETRALLWDQQGGIGYVPAGNDPRLNGNPPVSEIGLYLTMMLPRSERFAALTQFLALWACAVAVVLVGRRLGLSPRAAAYGGLVFATLPVVALHGAAILNDLVVASFLLACGRVPPRSRHREPCARRGRARARARDEAQRRPRAPARGPRGDRRRAETAPRCAAAIALAGGVLVGMPWYLVNLAETGSLHGDLATSTGQKASLSFGGVVGTLRALAFDVVDTSGFWQTELYVGVLVGAAVIGAGALAWRRSTTRGRTLVLAGLVVALVPLTLRAGGPPTRWLWEHSWLELGREDIALAHGDAWIVLGVPDTSQSWYGAAGAVVVLGGIAAAVVGVRRAELPPHALLLALAPLILIATFAVTIVYDPWRGRLLMFAVGLACAAWGWTIRVRWLSAGMAALCATTLALSLVHSHTKPAGFGLFEPPINRSIWHRDRIDELTVIRDYEGTPAILREVEASVPSDAELAVAMPVDSFLAPLAGPHLSRTLRLVPDGGRVPSSAAWLVTRDPSGARGCTDAWTKVDRDDDGRLAPASAYRARRLRRSRRPALAGPAHWADRAVDPRVVSRGNGPVPHGRRDAHGIGGDARGMPSAPVGGGLPPRRVRRRLGRDRRALRSPLAPPRAHPDLAARRARSRRARVVRRVEAAGHAPRRRPGLGVGRGRQARDRRRDARLARRNAPQPAWASQTASQSSRTQPRPPGRSSIHRASGTTSGQASAGTTGRPTAPRHDASLTSLPR